MEHFHHLLLLGEGAGAARSETPENLRIVQQMKKLLWEHRESL